jgi:hypothetical protein
MPPTPSLKSAQALSAKVTQHCRAINALSSKLEHAARKVEEYQTAIGQHIAAIKKARPDDWEDIVKAECNLGRTRAYELMAIASGTKNGQANPRPNQYPQDQASSKVRPFRNGRQHARRRHRRGGGGQRCSRRDAAEKDEARELPGGHQDSCPNPGRDVRDTGSAL